MSMDVFYKFSFQDLRTSVYSGIGHSVLSILECYNLFSGVELSMRSFFVIGQFARQSGTISERAFKHKSELSKSLESP